MQHFEEETLNHTDILLNQLKIPILVHIVKVFEPEDTNGNLGQYKSVANGTCLVSISPPSQMDNKCINIASREGRQKN